MGELYEKGAIVRSLSGSISSCVQGSCACACVGWGQRAAAWNRGLGAAVARVGVWVGHPKSATPACIDSAPIQPQTRGDYSL